MDYQACRSQPGSPQIRCSPPPHALILLLQKGKNKLKKDEIVILCCNWRFKTTCMLYMLPAEKQEIKEALILKSYVFVVSIAAA